MDTSVLCLLLLAAGWVIVMTIILAWQMTREKRGADSPEPDRSPARPAEAAKPEATPRTPAG